MKQERLQPRSLCRIAVIVLVIVLPVHLLLEALSWGALGAPLTALLFLAAIVLLHLVVWTALSLPFIAVGGLVQLTLTCVGRCGYKVS
jgi:hypothetical protein